MALNTVSINNTSSGWVQYSDTQYSSTNTFSVLADTWTTIPNNSGTVIDQYKPATNFTTFYDNTNQLINVDNVGDAFTLTLLFKVVSSQNNTDIEFGIDIGGSIGRIFPRVIKANESAGIVKEISFTLTGYQLDTFQLNGGNIEINPRHNIEIYDIIYIFFRTHSI